MEYFPDIGTPDYGLADQPTANIDEVELGDGYVTRRPKGINYLKHTWSPSWSGLEPDVARASHAWLIARLGLTPFIWTHPVSGVGYKVICRSASLTYNQYGDEVLSASFEQDFNP